MLGGSGQNWILRSSWDREGGCPHGSQNFSRSEADCDIRRPRMLPPDVWDRWGRSEDAWTEVAWKGRIAWRTGQDFGSQLVNGPFHPVHQRGHLVGEMSPGPLYNQRRHLKTAPGHLTTPCPAQWTWPKTQPWGSSSLRGSGGRDSTTTRWVRGALAPAPPHTRQQDGEGWPIDNSATDCARHQSKLASEPGVGDEDSSFVTKNNGTANPCDRGRVRVWRVLFPRNSHLVFLHLMLPSPPR